MHNAADCWWHFSVRKRKKGKGKEFLIWSSATSGDCHIQDSSKVQTQEKTFSVSYYSLSNSSGKDIVLFHTVKSKSSVNSLMQSMEMVKVWGLRVWHLSRSYASMSELWTNIRTGGSALKRIGFGCLAAVVIATLISGGQRRLHNHFNQKVSFHLQQIMSRASLSLVILPSCQTAELSLTHFLCHFIASIPANFHTLIHAIFLHLYYYWYWDFRHFYR